MFDERMRPFGSHDSTHAAKAISGEGARDAKDTKVMDFYKGHRKAQQSYKQLREWLGYMHSRMNHTGAVNQTDENLDEHPLQNQVTIDAYVINMAHRLDRCRCMEEQLEHFPGFLYRQEASTENDCGLKTAARSFGMTKAARGLFCTNYNIWHRAANTSADYIMILEDDTIFHPNIFKRLQNLLGGCSRIDYLAVDPWGRRSHVDPFVCREQQVRILPQARMFGAHMQVIKRTALPRLIEIARKHHMVPMDVWNLMYLGGARGLAREWRPALVSQAAKHYAKQPRVHVEVPSVCRSKELMDSDVGVFVGPGAHRRAVVTGSKRSLVNHTHRSGSELGRLGCGRESTSQQVDSL